MKKIHREDCFLEREHRMGCGSREPEPSFIGAETRGPWHSLLTSGCGAVGSGDRSVWLSEQEPLAPSPSGSAGAARGGGGARAAHQHPRSGPRLAVCALGTSSDAPEVLSRRESSRSQATRSLAPLPREPRAPGPPAPCTPHAVNARVPGQVDGSRRPCAGWGGVQREPSRGDRAGEQAVEAKRSSPRCPRAQDGVGRAGWWAALGRWGQGQL